MRFWCFFLLALSSLAQEAPVYFDRGSYSVGLGISFPQASWKAYQAPAGPFFHLEGTALWNPVAKSERPSPVMVGVAGGYIGLGREAVPSAILGQFYRTHQVLWLQALGRYRPILWASQWNPFLELGVGPGRYGTGVYEQLSEEIIRIEGQGAIGFTYQAGVGFGRKVDRKSKSPLYVDLAWHLFQTDGLSWVDRGSTRILSDGQIAFQRRIRSLNHQKIGLFITGFW